MTTQALRPQPQPTFPFLRKDMRPEQAWAGWLSDVNAILQFLNGTNNSAGAPNVGSLFNAANDAAAAAGGVPVGGLYRTGNAVQIRLV